MQGDGYQFKGIVSTTGYGYGYGYRGKNGSGRSGCRVDEGKGRKGVRTAARKTMNAPGLCLAGRRMSVFGAWGRVGRQNPTSLDVGRVRAMTVEVLCSTSSRRSRSRRLLVFAIRGRDQARPGWARLVRRP
jgi:hypothetical protein